MALIERRLARKLGMRSLKGKVRCGESSTTTFDRTSLAIDNGNERMAGGRLIRQ